MKKLFLISVSLLISVILFSQNVEGIRTETQANEIYVYYQITNSIKKDKFEVSIDCNVDGRGKEMSSISGDIGGVKGGKSHYLIIWKVKEKKKVTELKDVTFTITMLIKTKKGTRTRIAKGSVETFTIDENRIVRKKKAKIIVAKDKTPPIINITFPKIVSNIPFETFDNVINLKGLITDKSDIAKLTINGSEIASSKSFSSNVLLRFGVNKIIIVASDSENNISKKEIIIERKREITDNIAPKIVITHPNVERGFKVVEMGKQVEIRGKVTDESGIFEVLVNGREAYLDNQGNFSITVALAVGENSFTVRASDMKQNRTTKEFKIQRESKSTETNVESVATNNSTNNNALDKGKYYALIIGVSEYQDDDIVDLNNEPVKDATELSNILTDYYTFEKSDVTLLKNPTYRTIVRSFDDLNKIITEEDNLLIFYAGHGYYSEDEKVGYWLPSDAELEYTDAWLYNSVLVDNIKKINTKHTFLIADACFSGSIFKTRSLSKKASVAYQKKYELKSRNAITSGTLKTVPNESVFFKYLSQKLKNNKQEYMSASEFFLKIEIPVGNNSPNTPQFGNMQNVGDEGGDFIFILR